MPVYLFDRFTLDTDLRELRTDQGSVVALQPKVYALLAQLAGSPHVVISQQELQRNVWGGVKVTESSLTRAISILRAALLAVGASPRIIRSVRGAGYTLGVEVSRVQAPATRASGGPPPRSPDFVERDRELEILHGCLDEALCGRGSLVTVSGDPGIGKSRLLRELAWQAEQRGARLLMGRCGEVEGSVAYGLWIQVVHAAAAGKETEVERLLGAAAHDLAPLAPSLARREEVRSVRDPDQLRLQLFQAVAALLAARAAERPLVVVLDDLQDADAASLRLLEYLAHRVTRGPLLIVSAFRDVEAAPGSRLGLSLAELMRAGCPVEQVVLTGLSASGVKQLAQRAGGAALEADDLDVLMQRTAGNPLFVRELLLMRGDAAPLWPELRRAIPQTVRRLIGLRLAQLPGPAREVLALGAALGQRFSAATLAHAAAVSLDELRIRLRPAELARVVGGAPDSLETGFTHALFRECLYGELDPAARVDAHVRVGLALEHSGIEDSALSELAHHFGIAARDGRECLRAIRYTRLAAAHALRHVAFEQAAAHVERLLELEDAQGELMPSRRMDLTIVLAELRYRCGEASEASRLLREVLLLAEQTESDAHIVTVLARLSDRGFWDGSVRERIALTERLLPRLADRPQLQARAMAALAEDLQWVSLPRSRALNDRALTLARRHRDPLARAQALAARYRLLAHPSQICELLRTAREAERFGRRVRDVDLVFTSWFHRMFVAIRRAQLDDARAALAAMQEIAATHRAPAHLAYLRAAQVGEALLSGDLLSADRGAETLLAEISKVRSSEEAFLLHAAQLGAVRALQGRLPELLPLMRQLAATYPQVLGLRIAQIAAHLQARDTGLARSLLVELLPPGFDDFPPDFMHGVNAALAAEAAAELGDRSRSERLHELLEPYAGELIQCAFCAWGAADRYLGLCTAALGRANAAIRHLEAALALETRIDAPILRARTALELARALEARGSTTDRSSAKGLRRLASELADSGRGWTLDSLVPTLPGVFVRKNRPGRRSAVAAR